MELFSHKTTLPLITRVLRAYLRTNLRGQTRGTLLLAQKLEQLQFVPITIENCFPFYVDLRKGQAQELLKGTPWPAAPWEADEQNVMRRVIKDHDVAFDIGANIGLHTVWLSRLVGTEGRLCVFEPNVELLPQLRRTVEGLNNAVLYPYALSDRAQEAPLFIPEDHSMASLSNWTKGAEDIGETRTITCQVRTMNDLVDSVGIPQPDFIKCDVEGAELMVFRGGCNTLNRVDAPIIMFEANVHNARGFELSVGDARNYLASLSRPDYQFLEIVSGGALMRTEMSNPIHSNILAVPQSKMDRIQ